jgi:hypothetical protein
MCNFHYLQEEVVDSKPAKESSLEELDMEDLYTKFKVVKELINLSKSSKLK